MVSSRPHSSARALALRRAVVSRRASTARAALALAMTVAAALGAGGCGRDPRPACTGAYQHLVALAKRNPDPDGEYKFVSACVDAWDPERVKCLEGAKTIGEALACKPVKKRPG